MVIYELLAIIVFLWFMVITVNKDVFSPSSLLCLSYILAIICAIYNVDNWKIDLHYNTFGIIVIGIFSFIITSFFYKIIKTKKLNYKKNEIVYISIKKNRLIILNCISLLIFSIYTFYFIKAIGGVYAFSNFSVAMQIYRSKTLYHNLVLIPSWINFLIKICRAIAYIYSYILINNILIKKNDSNLKKLDNLHLYISGILVYFPLTIMSGGRYDLIVYILYIIVTWSILYRIECKKNINVKNFIKIGILIILILIAFSNFKGIVGRKSESSTLDYITEYFGGSIQIFDMYMQDSNHGSQNFGEETFAGIRKFLNQLKIIDSRGNKQETMKFRSLYDGRILGNVYTGFRKLYQDFGLSGVIILQSLLSVIFNTLYYNCFYKNEKNKIFFSVILCGSLSFCLILHSFSEAFYSTVLSFNYITLFIIMICIIKFLQKTEIKRG